MVIQLIYLFIVTLYLVCSIFSITTKTLITSLVCTVSNTDQTSLVPRRIDHDHSIASNQALLIKRTWFEARPYVLQVMLVCTHCFSPDLSTSRD